MTLLPTEHLLETGGRQDFMPGCPISSGSRAHTKSDDVNGEATASFGIILLPQDAL